MKKIKTNAIIASGKVKFSEKEDAIMKLKRFVAAAISAAMLLMSCSCTVELTNGRPESDDYSSYYEYDSSDVSSEASSEVSSDEIKMGNEDVGWLTIDDSFYKFYDTNPGVSDSCVQYCKGPYDILTLDVIEGYDAQTYASLIMTALEGQSDISGLTGAKVTVGDKYEAYQVYCYYTSSNQFLVIWCIDSPSAKKTYYIAAEFTADNSDLIDYVETYQMPEE